jgi:hypothetical protein
MADSSWVFVENHGRPPKPEDNPAPLRASLWERLQLQSQASNPTEHPPCQRNSAAQDAEDQVTAAAAEHHTWWHARPGHVYSNVRVGGTEIDAGAVAHAPSFLAFTDSLRVPGRSTPPQWS